MEITNFDGFYRVSGDTRRYKTLRGARNRARTLQARLEHKKRVEFFDADAKPLPDNVVRIAFNTRAPSAPHDGTPADLIRVEFLHRGYIGVYNESKNRAVAGPALVQEWKNAGGRAAWKASERKRLLTDRERVRRNQREDGRFT